MQPSTPDMDARFTIGYDLGAVGTWVRLLLGVVAAGALLAVDLSEAGSAFVVEVGGWFLGILAVYTAVYVALAPRLLARVNPWVSTVLFYGPVLVLPYIEALPDALQFALGLYVTVSIVVVVFVRYGGCEVVGIPSLLVRRRHVVYCPWNTVDLVDKAIEDSRWSDRLQGAGVKVAAVAVAAVVFIAGGFALDELGPLIWVVVAAGSVGVVGAAVLLSRGTDARG